MGRLIDADAFKEYMRSALEQTRRCYPDGGEWAEAVTEEFCRDIDEQPTVEPECKPGRWERHYSRPNVYADLFWHCSACGYKSADSWTDKYYNFCPNCGADMRREENSVIERIEE